MRSLCSRREYCSSDILKKSLTLLDGNQETANDVLAALIKDKYVDDLRYATAYARDKSVISGWGVVKIRHALALKSIPRDIVSAALEEIDGDRAQVRLEKLMEAKARSLRNDPHPRLKLIRYALGRGYGYDEVSMLVDMLLNAD